MKHICFTHVDADTGIPCTVEPMRTGPSFPSVKGLEVIWWDESKWPTYEPKFFGACDDDADVTVPGVLQVISMEQFNQQLKSEMDARWNSLRPHLEAMVMGALDGMAVAHGYESTDDVISLSNSGDPEKEADASYCLGLKSEVLAVVHKFIEDVDSGLIPKPDGIHVLVDLLPPLKWRGES